jgi:site-specific recombinase XerD
MSHSRLTIEQILAQQIDTLALSLRPASIAGYRAAVRNFLKHLRAAFPQIQLLSQLRRDPHLTAWFRSLCEHDPPLANPTREKWLFCIRRLLSELASNGHTIASDLIRREDFPAHQRYFPRPLSVDDDCILQQELRRTGDLPALALLLIRATGIRIGECVDLALDCLRQIGANVWALHVPLGKLHSERLVPVDADVRQIVDRILQLRPQAPRPLLAESPEWLLRPLAARSSFIQTLRQALHTAAQRAVCSGRVTPHRLRHSFAAEMLRLGVSLPALMQMMGHRDIRMTLYYIEVTQQDLQREFHQARKKAGFLHSLPPRPVPHTPTAADVPSIHEMIAAARHLMDSFSRQLRDQAIRRRLQRLDHRLLAVAKELDRLSKTKNE